MQFSTGALFALAASVASADVVFHVSDFNAACIPHSSQCSISFGVIRTGTGETTPVQCSAMLTSNGSIPEVTEGTCENSSRTWTFTKFSTNHASGFELAVSQQMTPSSSVTGRYDLFDGSFEYQQTGASSQQAYVGDETEFDLVH
ncbi:hypersensitive response-inducing protein [Diaporthe helianthi]|uniref:Hypersensitive response-inducing protein n=1 Tax=Diaporthe helianthi TaxID=158607 RepID=A0A2P5IC51_DIAHE|nr:hypersensitive response-inducing protein [Diaporthe helianthi]